MPHLRKPEGAEDGWYANKATDSDGKPREIVTGFITFSPEQVRMVTARERTKCGRGFEMSLANGNLDGPYPTKEAASSGTGKAAPKVEAKKEPEPEPEPVVEAEPEPAPDPEPTLFEDDEPTDPGQPSKKKRKKKASKKSG